ncbi:MAG: DivIVA domain-containing protein [Actinobacteria bacterium]|nr:DivIVA domain-containing protein [Actinomycetota bacterium]
MALTPEDVLNQKFTITKFRDGYDLDQVDEFLDTIVEEIREREQQTAELREQLEAANAEVESLRAQLSAAGGAAPASERTIVVDAPAAPAAVQEAPRPAAADADAIKSSAMLQLALELHDKHVHEGETKRDQLISAAEEKADQLVSDAERQRAEVLRKLEGESNDLRDVIKELRDFEGEYRSTLRSYIQSQLRNLDGSPEPDGAPAGIN